MVCKYLPSMSVSCSQYKQEHNKCFPGRSWQRHDVLPSSRAAVDYAAKLMTELFNAFPFEHSLIKRLSMNGG